MSEYIKKHQLVSYFFLAFLITWAIFFIPLFMPIDDPVNCILLMGIGGSGPAFAAIILSRILNPTIVKTDTRKYLAVFLSAAVVTAALIIMYLGIHPASFSLTLLLLVVINAAIAAYIISGGLCGREGIREMLGRLYIWKTGWRWYVMAVVFIPAVMIFSLVACTLYAGLSLNEIAPQLSLGVASSVIITLGYVTLLRGPLREEIGWRGFALPRLQYLYSPLVGTLILGILWTVWHLPLHLNGIYSGGMDGFIERFYFNIGVTFLFTWIYNHSRGSLLMTTLFHTSINTTATVLFSPGVIDGPFSILFSILINISAIVVIVKDRMWRKLPEDHEAVYAY